MVQSYNLVLSSYISTNRIGTNKRNYQYYVNWNSILKNNSNTQWYRVRYSFITPAVATVGEVFNLYINFAGSSNSYDQLNSRTDYLGFVLPYANQTSSTTGTNENLPITIEYPQNNIITVWLVNLNANYPAIYFNNDYILNLEFTPKDD